MMLPLVTTMYLLFLLLLASACAIGNDTQLNITLVGGIGPYEGTVQVTYGNRTGVICDDDWDLDDAIVVCRALGYSVALAATEDNEFNFNGSDSDILFDDFECNGNEESLLDCDHNGFTIHNCAIDETAGVICGNEGDLNFTLIGGNSPNEGTVQVTWRGYTGVICDDDWDIEVANVACRMLGFSGVVRAVEENYFNYSGGTILFDDFDCSGDERNLLECDHDGIREHDCDISETAGVICHNGTELSVHLAGGSSPSEGTVVVSFGGTTGVICDDNWDLEDANVTCRMLGYVFAVAALKNNEYNFNGSDSDILFDDFECNGNEESLLDCGHDGFKFHDCDIGDTAGVACSNEFDTSFSLTLIGGNSPNEGTVQVKYRGFTGVICDDDWDIEDANVACRMLNFSGGLQTVVNYFNYSGGLILFDNFDCNGDETSLLDCDHNGFRDHNCDISESAGVFCYNGPTPKPSIHLDGGNSSSEGTVIVSFGGSTGVICDDSWDLEDANVTCRMLGYVGALRADRENLYGYVGEDSHILFEEFDCNGDEENLLDCGHDGFRNHDCDIDETAGVVCDVDGTCLEGWSFDVVSKRCYKWFNERITKDEMWPKCLEHGAKPVNIQSRATHVFMKSISQGFIWLDLWRQETVEESWLWGSEPYTLSWTNWRNSHHDHTGKCVMMEARRRRKWRVVHCRHWRATYICVMPPPHL